jgi:phage FluMu protein gp41
MKRFSGTSNGVVNKNNPIRIALLENQRIMSSVLTPNNQVPNTVQGDVSVVDRHTSNIGKGLAENDRLTKILHGLDYKQGTLIVHDEALDMQNSRIGKGLAEHDRLNHQLQEIHVKEKNILVRGSKRAAMNKIRKGNALLRRNIAQIKQHRKVQIKLSMRQVRQENAKLRQQIALAQQKKLINPVSKALNENKRLKATLVDGDEQISVVNKQTSNIGKGLAEKERLTKILHDIRHGGGTINKTTPRHSSWWRYTAC